MRDTYPQMFGDRWQEAGRLFYARFEERHLETLTPLPGAAELIEALHAAGLYLAVVSNKQGDYLRQEAAHLGWDRYFGTIVGAFDAAEDKPSVAPVDMALSNSGVSRGRDVWFVGDANIDLECAQRAGCVPVLIRNEPPGAGEFEPHPPAFHAVDCIALSNVLLTL
jgi:phosphoglycolate phosphatase